jgi:ribonuclease HI
VPRALYDGPLIGYDRPILDVPDDTAVPKRASSSSAPKAAAYSYLSVVGGVAMRHTTWADCERRVKVQSGARFKKTASAADETAILRGWGIDPERL